MRYLRAAGSAAYWIYRSLQQSGPGRRCTYCRYQVADSLDHVIPKTLMSALSIEPWNLVPACSLCNRSLRAQWPTDPAQRMLHPYFMPKIGRWLYARVDNGAPGTDEEVVVRFYAEPDTKEFGEELCSRVRWQFASLGLDRTFGAIAVDELRPIQATLRAHFERKDDAHEHLSEQSDIHFEVDPNNLRGVLYETLAQDDTFIGNHLKRSSTCTEWVNERGCVRSVDAVVDGVFAGRRLIVGAHPGSGAVSVEGAAMGLGQLRASAERIDNRLGADVFMWCGSPECRWAMDAPIPSPPPPLLPMGLGCSAIRRSRPCSRITKHGSG